MKRTATQNGFFTTLQICLFVGIFLCLSCKLEWGGDDNGSSDADSCLAVNVERVSVSSAGSQANGNSSSPSISSDGQFIAFISEASNLVINDTNDFKDVFVHDRDTGNTERVSVTSGGTESDDDSSTPSLSSNGTLVAFGSLATNLVVGDTNDVSDIFVHNRDTGVTERVSIASDGTQADGRSSYPSISSDGRYVAFVSDATNLVADDTNNKSDIFVRDRVNATTERISSSTAGDESNGNSFFTSISSDGNFVAFSSEASNLDVDDLDNQIDIFVHDRDESDTQLLVGPVEFNTGSGLLIVAPVISPEGDFVGFRSNADDLVISDANNSFDTFLLTRETQIIERVSVSTSDVGGNSDSSSPSISSDNRFTVFSSIANNLVSEDTNGFEDVFVRDRDESTTRRVSLAFDCAEGDSNSSSAVVSGDGNFIALTSSAENLIENDTNGSVDVFVIPNPITP